MYIAPTGTVKVLHNVPLDTTYDHTIYFANATAQTNYFQGLTKFTFPNVSYQRVRRGWMRIEKNAEALYDCNYVMFKNTEFDQQVGSKWFYAYIKSVEYVNDKVSEIQFEIDVMQTWMFDYELEKCFVVREHSLHDNIGDNLMPEPVNLGQYVTGESYTIDVSDYGHWCVVMVCTADPDVAGLIPPRGQFLGGTYQQAIIKKWDTVTEDADDITEEIESIMTNLSLFNNMDSVVAFYMCPDQLVPTTGTSIETALASRQKCHLGQKRLPVSFNSPTLGDYVNIKNNKLLTYPYSYLFATNNQGDQIELRYEFFNSLHPEATKSFELYCDMSIDPTLCLIPNNYLVSNEAQDGVTIHNFEYNLQAKGFPKCTLATNDLIAKLTQGTIAITLAALTHGISLAGSAALAVNPSNWSNRTDVDFSETANQTQLVPYNDRKYVQAETTPDLNYKLTPLDAAAAGAMIQAVYRAHPYAKIGQGNVNYVTDTLGFTLKQTFISPEFAKTIDDFFSMYGYQTNELKIPNISSRPHWNYVRTSNCTIRGSVPADDAKRICEIYNKGITFWKNGNEVGHYELDNRPISVVIDDD